MLIFASIAATVSIFFLKKWANPDLFFIYFRLFKHTLQFLQQINVKKCPSSIRFRDSNSQPMEHESPPITTRPGLPPKNSILLLWLTISLSYPVALTWTHTSLTPGREHSTTLREGSLYLQLVSSLTRLKLAKKENNMLLFVWSESKIVKLETSCTVILPSIMLSVL